VHLHIQEFVVDSSLVRIPVIMIMGTMDLCTDLHLFLLGIIEEDHAEALALASLVGGLDWDFDPTEVVAVIDMMITDVVTEVVSNDRIDVTTIERKSK